MFKLQHIHEIRIAQREGQSTRCIRPILFLCEELLDLSDVLLERNIRLRVIPTVLSADQAADEPSRNKPLNFERIGRCWPLLQDFTEALISPTCGLRHSRKKQRFELRNPINVSVLCMLLF